MYKKKKKNEQDLKRKLTKDDISLPSNFRYGLKFYPYRIRYSLPEHPLTREYNAESNLQSLIM